MGFHTGGDDAALLRELLLARLELADKHLDLRGNLASDARGDSRVVDDRANRFMDVLALRGTVSTLHSSCKQSSAAE